MKSQPGPPVHQARTFHWSELRAIAKDLDARFDLQFDPAQRRFQCDEVVMVPPAIVPWPFARKSAPGTDGESARERAARLSRARDAGGRSQLTDSHLLRLADSVPSFLPKQCVVLLQAGASSIAYFDRGEVLATKSMKRYVKRGNGRAQPTYLAAKGRSRYGSRLRLQNARALHDDVNRRLHALWEEFGSPAQIFVSAPKRIWADQFEGAVTPPFDRDTPIERIALDLPTPTTDVLLRAYKSLGYGQLRWYQDASHGEGRED